MALPTGLRQKWLYSFQHGSRGSFPNCLRSRVNICLALSRTVCIGIFYSYD
jgi:hypothetical protein